MGELYIYVVILFVIYVYKKRNSFLLVIQWHFSGLVQLDMEPSTKHTEKLHRTVSLGGHWRPADCTPIQHVAIIIPHRQVLLSNFDSYIYSLNDIVFV